MAKQITRLNVGLSGDIGNFSHAFGTDAVKTVGTFVSGIGAAGASLVAFSGIATVVGGAVAALATSIGAAFEVKEQLGAIDAIAKLSDRIGVGTEALVGMQHAADLSGVSTEALTSGFEKMFKTLGKAMGGGKDAIATFDSLGLNFQTLQAESPEDAFKQIAQRISEITNPAQRAAAAMDVFGKSGQGLLPLLTKGAAGLSAAQQEAVKLGLTFSRIDAAKVERANEAVTRLKSVLIGMSRTAAIAIAPFLEFGADKITAALSAVIPVFRSFSSMVANTFSSIGATIVPYLENFRTVVSRTFDLIYPYVANALGNVWAVVQEVWSNITTFTTTVGAGIYAAIVSRWESIVASVTGLVMGVWDVVEAVWSQVAELSQEAWGAVVSVVEWATGGVTASTGDMSGNVTGAFGSVIDGVNSFVDDITLSINVAEYAITHWQEVVNLMSEEVLLALVSVGNDVAYTFTDVIPAYLIWLSDNWTKVFTDMTSFTGVVFANIAANVVAVFENLPGLIAGTTSLDKIWTPLTEGFTSTMQALPEIAAREQGDLEKSLSADVTQSEQAMGEDLLKHLAKRHAEAQNGAKAVSDSLKNAFNFKNQEIKPPKIEKPEPLKTSLNPDTLTVSIVPKLAKALKAGGAEAQALAFQVPKFSGGSATPGAIQSPTPQPLERGDDGGDDDFADAKDDDNTRKDQNYLDKIEKNTRQPVLQIAKF